MKTTDFAQQLEFMASSVEVLQSERARLARSVPRNVRQVVRVMEANRFDPSLTVERILEECRIYNHNISSLFRVHMGLGIRRYLEELRLRAAEELLTITEAEVYLIAYHVGYTQVETFHRAFRRTRGVAPGRWRELRRRA